MRRENLEPIELVEVSGTPYEIGRQYGEACSEKIKKMVDWWAGQVTLLYPEVDKKKMISMTKQFLEPTKEYAPDLVDEMKGIAEGAKVSLEEILFANAVCEPLLYCEKLGGCTSFAATGEATKNGETITGQNLDWRKEAELVVLRAQPSEGPKYLALCYVGSLGMMGINSAGIAHQTNLLWSESSGVGVPAFNVINQKILQQKNLADVLGVIYTPKKSGSWNYLMASSEGDIVDVEGHRDDFSVLYPERDFIVHTNNFLTDRLKSTDLVCTTLPDSYLRVNRMTRLIEKHYGELSVDLMKTFLADHNDYPDSICRHIDTEDLPETHLFTRASIISVPKEQKMYISNGNPCENEFVEYKL